MTVSTAWRPRPGAAVTAHQWLHNGDHPGDNCRMITPEPQAGQDFSPFRSEGQVVRYYRHPQDYGGRDCGDCGYPMHHHGWIDQGVRGRVVCPGDWIVTVPASTPGAAPYYFPVKPDLLTVLFETSGPA